MTDNELKPCPFCGGGAAVLYHQSNKYTDYDGDYVYCMKCGCRTRLYECFNGTGKTHKDTEKEAINAWNNRANDDLINRQRAEIVRYKIAVAEALQGVREAKDLLVKALAEERSEAIKEFVERLKDVFTTIDGTFECWEVEEHIDNLVKEMTEGTE
jgi:Lar family restriction alleviation protein